MKMTSPKVNNSDISTVLQTNMNNSVHEAVGTGTLINLDNMSLTCESENEFTANTTHPVHNSVPIPHYMLNELVSEMRPFSGQDNYYINMFITDVDYFLCSYNVTDNFQKLLICRKLLTGIAKTFIQSQRNITTFSAIIEALKSEFETTVSARDIHVQLSKCKHLPHQTLNEYLITLRELASYAPTPMDDVSIIDYCIRGINDSNINKTILFGCKTIPEFKERLKIYEKSFHNVRPNPNQRRYDPKNQEPSFANRRNSQFTSRNQHGSFVRSSAHTTDSDVICYLCNEKGHKSFQCSLKRTPRTTRYPTPGQKPFPRNDVNAIKFETPQKIYKTVQLLQHTAKALIDPGSDVTLIDFDHYQQIGEPQLTPTDVLLSGISDREIKPLGHFSAEITLDSFSVPTRIYVLQNCNHPFIIGLDILSQLNIQICQGKLTILPIPEKPLRKISINILTASKKENVETAKSENDAFLHHLPTYATKAVDLEHIPSDIRDKLMPMIENYEPRKTKSTQIKMNIVLSDESPVASSPRRISLYEQKIVEQEIKNWMDLGIIKPSCSDFSAPLVLCKKKDNSYRLCVDFRRLNKKIIKDRFPLPLIEDVLDSLDGANVFSTIDLRNAFFHVDVEEKCTKYLSFVTHNGQYEFTKTPFGLCTSPSVFQRYIYAVFRELLADKTLVIYLDDIIIPSRDEHEGLLKLQRVFQVASDYGLQINFKKCQFLNRNITFLGYSLANGQIRPSEEKTKAVMNFPEPKNAKSIQSYLGLTGYFRKFIPNYAQIAKPLSDLLRNNTPFKFGPEQVNAFQHLKTALSKDPVLHIYKQGAPLELHTDASSLGFGAVLLQKSDDGCFHPIHYMSRKTTPQQEKYCSYELEVLAIVEAVKKFRTYLLGTKFKIITDCEAFKKTVNKKDLPPKVARWAILLEEFDFEVVHRPGKQMKHADALSRNAVLMINSCNEVTKKIAIAQNNDEYIGTLKQLVNQGDTAYVIRNDILYKIVEDKELLVVPSSLQTEIVRNAHEKNGHFSTSKTEDIVKKEFYFPHMHKCVENVIATCVPCILINRKKGKSDGLLHPIPKEDVPFGTYHIDFLGPLPSTSKKYQYIFAVTDAFTKFLWLYPVKATSSHDALNSLRIQQEVFGNPSRIIADKGSAFTSKDFVQYCEDEHIQLVHITTGLPRGNGQIERMFQTIIPVLSKLSIDDPTKWYQHVRQVQQTINSTITRSTGSSPFQLLTGVTMKRKDNIKILDILQEELINSFKTQRDDLRHKAKENILKIQEENRQNYNRRRKTPHNYKIGDLVAIARTQFGTGLKLRPRFYGPYVVKNVKEHDRYEVEKIGVHDGPNLTSTAADHMKIWT